MVGLSFHRISRIADVYSCCYLAYISDQINVVSLLDKLRYVMLRVEPPNSGQVGTSHSCERLSSLQRLKYIKCVLYREVFFYYVLIKCVHS